MESVKEKILATFCAFCYIIKKIRYKAIDTACAE